MDGRTALPDIISLLTGDLTLYYKVLLHIAKTLHAALMPRCTAWLHPWTDSVQLPTNSTLLDWATVCP
eukprot:2883726-Prorocentrum_lima.AAC.1